MEADALSIRALQPECVRCLNDVIEAVVVFKQSLVHDGLAEHADKLGLLFHKVCVNLLLDLAET